MSCPTIYSCWVVVDLQDGGRPLRYRSTQAEAEVCLLGMILDEARRSGGYARLALRQEFSAYFPMESYVASESRMVSPAEASEGSCAP